MKDHVQSTAAVEIDLLDDFSGGIKIGPIAAFAATAVAVYWFVGWTEPFVMLVKLWFGYASAFFVLAAFASGMNPNRSLGFVIAAGSLGVVIGGAISALLAVAPNWWLLQDVNRLLTEWLEGAVFAAIFVIWSIGTSAILRQRHIVLDSTRRLAEARLQALQAQIEPHFLMNTLANLRYLIKQDGASAVTMLDHLADFMQGALNRSRTTRSSIGQELDFIANYLSIMQIRMRDRLSFSIVCPEALRTTELPPLLLQPLVENAIAHGLEPSASGGTLRVEVCTEGKTILVVIMDDGIGVQNASADGKGNGLGIRNVRERLEAFYGASATLTVDPQLPQGTIAKINIPLIPH